jgi:flavin-dependent dehydrogenase
MLEPPSTSAPTPSYDVVVIGGALSGAATAILLLRHNPGIRVLIVEKSTRLTRRVGEATVEISAYFIGRVLGMTHYLNEEHIVKQGLRFWFRNEHVTNLSEASELGTKYLSRITSYQLDRSKFDEEVLRRAGEAGATILRPATVSHVELKDGDLQTLEVKHDGALKKLHARWIVDASGFASFLARHHGWWRSNSEHPHRRRLVPLEGREGLGQPRIRNQVPPVVPGGVRHSQSRHQPHYRGRLVELVDPAKRRRCERGHCH